MHFSIIIPSYNSEKTIKRCLDSVLKQTFENFECLVIDDGSTDASREIIDSYAAKDTRFRVIHKENEGVSSSRNVGLDIAQGKYIIFIDADDYIDSDYLENFSYSNADIIVANVNIISDSPQLCRKEVKSNEIIVLDFKYNNVLKDFQNKYYLKTPWAKAFKKILIDKFKLRFNPKISFGEDTLFNLQFIKSAKIIEFTGKSYYNYIESTEKKTYDFDIYKYQLSIREFIQNVNDLRIDKNIKNHIIKINKTLYHCIFYRYCKSQKTKQKFYNISVYIISRTWRYAPISGCLGKMKAIAEYSKLLFA